jgi:hypothetical protein
VPREKIDNLCGARHTHLMDVKRSDMLKWAQSAQLSTQKAESGTTGKADELRPETKAQVTVDTMRTKVLSLQQEIREIQTGISMRQIQLGFLNQVNEGAGWQKELKRFMTEQFPTVNLEMGNKQNIDEYKSEAAQVVSSLRGNLIKKEIQIQNILSAGLFEPAASGEQDPTIDNSRIVKDFSDTKDIFSKLRPETVKSLVN